ncbi:MAG: hypothetical protein R3A48_25775 [Polyangiales bacterium]
MEPTPAEPLTLPQRLVAERPQGRTRSLVRAASALLVVTFAASLVLSTLFPDRTLMPRALSLALGMGYLVIPGLSVAAALSQLWCWVAPRLRADVTASGAGVTLRRAWGQRVISPAAVSSGWTLRTATQAEVELELQRGDLISIEVRDPREADAILDAAGVLPEERALTMRLGSPASRLAIALASLLPGAIASSVVALAVSSLLGLPSAAMGFLIFTLTALSAALAVRVFGPPTVRVGRDGVSVRGWRRDEFIPYAGLAGVSVIGSSIALPRVQGAPVVFPAWGTPAARRDALVARVGEALAESRARGDLSARLETLDRNGRDVASWRAALDALSVGRDDYRSASLSRDELVAALDDPGASGDRRVAAAYALSKIDPDAAGARVRLAVETVAHEPVRVALSRAAEGDLDEAALRELDEARARPR